MLSVSIVCLEPITAAAIQVLPPPEAEGSFHISRIPPDFRRRNNYQFLKSDFSVKIIF